MRFITEFELDDDKFEYFHKITCLGKLGTLIEKTFGWETVDSHKNELNIRRRLEIEAFPMDKWVEFKRKLISMVIENGYYSKVQFENLIKELESFGNTVTTNNG